ncbi:Double-strand-break repair protein rad21-like protein [Armadillidium vulgare]|nr:Double-strand-break repair protein rad21-like protein [Armadillidium vulgare]
MTSITQHRKQVITEVKMALRTSGHLLLGVVRIYSRKAKYLLADCNEAFVKIKMAFRPGMVDLPEDIREAAVSAITFPEVFHDFDTPMPELNDVDIQAQFTLNQSRAEEITMREDYGNISLVTGDDGFGDMGFEEPPDDLMRATSAIDQNMDQTNLMFENIDKERDDNSSKEQNSRLSCRQNASALDLEAPIRDDGFGGNLGQDIIGGGLFEGGLFDDAPIEEAPLDNGQQDKTEKIPDDSDDDGGDIDRFGGPPSVGPPSSDGGSPSPSPRLEQRTDTLTEEQPINNEPEGDSQETPGEAQDQTTLLHNDEESFALAPVDSTVIRSGWPRTKRKRKLIVDEVKNISGEEMKAQLSDTTDIVTTLDLAPPSKRLMHWKETGGVEKLFALPGRAINAVTLAKIYVRNLTSEHANNEDFGMAGDKEIENLRLEQVRDEEVETVAAPRPRGRPPKRKHPEPDFQYEEERYPKYSSIPKHHLKLITPFQHQNTDVFLLVLGL